MQAEQPQAASGRVLPPVPTSLEDLDLEALLPEGGAHPSPRRWNDQVCYFLLPDRFSDGKESERALYKPERAAEFALPEGEKEAWATSAMQWQGGNLRGIMSQLPYIKGLGITTIWLGPIYKQRIDEPTYHGYAIQNFLEVDPHLGTREDLIELVKLAHSMGMYVLLDVIFNHTGDNFFYKHEGKMVSTMPYRDHHKHPFGAWKDEHGKPCEKIQSLEDGVWPKEFQDPEWYFRAGTIADWDKHPEFVRGDFMTLKSLNLDRGDTLSALVQVYRYWIALTDCDGFRLDTVKHVPLAAAQRFCQGIHEFAHSIGKDKFLMVGEVSGPAPMRLRFLGGGLPFTHNLDAVLDIGEQSKRLCNMYTLSDQCDLQLVFQAKDALENLREAGFLHFIVLDDHDMIWQYDEKARVGHINDGPLREKRVANLTNVQLTLPGIPCIYYGTELALNGHGNHDKYLRENLFGGDFGAFATRGCHFFDRQHPTYLRIAAVGHLRARADKVGLTLRHGRMYLRDVCPIAFTTRAQRDESDRVEREKLKKNLKKQGSHDAVDTLLRQASLSRAHSIESIASDTLKNLKKNNNRNTKTLRRRLLRANTNIDLRLTEEEVMADEHARWWRESRRGEVLAWSRIHYNCEVLVVLNTHPTEERRALVTIDRRLQERKLEAKLRHHENAQATMSILYHSQWSDATLEAVLASPTSSLYSSSGGAPATTTAEEGSATEDKERIIRQLQRSVPVQQQKDGRFFVSISLPAAAMAILH